jgi:hypothetical protein
MTLSAMEFLRRFVQHILPRGFRPHSTVGPSRQHLSDHPCRPRADTPQCAAHHQCNARHRDRDTDGRHLGMSALRRRDDPRADPFGAPTDDDHPWLRQLMTTDPTPPAPRRRRCGHPRLDNRLSRARLGAPRPSPRASVRPALRSCHRCTDPNPPEYTHPDTVEPGL